MVIESPLLAASSKRTEARTAGLGLRLKESTVICIFFPFAFLFRIQKIRASRGEATERPELRAQIEERDRLMEALLRRTAHFRIGAHPTREELNAR